MLSMQGFYFRFRGILCASRLTRDEIRLLTHATERRAETIILRHLTLIASQSMLADDSYVLLQYTSSQAAQGFCYET